jgi:superfamily II DNA or RNA helicase
MNTKTERRTLLPCQTQALEYLKDHPRGALFMEMRLGKTLVVIRHAQRLSLRRILVVAPKTVLISWIDELVREGELYTLTSHTRDLPPLKYRTWVLVSYQWLRVHASWTLLEWDLVVLDESTAVKNPQAQITRTCNGGVQNRKRYSGFLQAQQRVILSGMPVPEGIENIYEQFNFLFPGWLGCNTYWDFRAKYFKRTALSGEWIPQSGSQVILKQLMHKLAFCLRRKEAGVHLPKIHERRHIDMPAKWLRDYKVVERDWVDGNNSTTWAVVLNTWLSRMAGGFTPEGELKSTHKLDELKSLLQGELKGEHLVVWCRFLRELEEVNNLLTRIGVPAVVIQGKCSQEVRSVRLKQFQTGQVQVLVAQERCARYGLDCSVADTAVYYSNEYSLETRLQSEDRILNPTKFTPSLIVDLVSRGTVDEDLQYVLRQKRLNATMFMRDLQSAFERRQSR